MNMSKTLYLEDSLQQIPRLLCLLDREFLSPTCGSFDRPYWHHRTKDFSSAALQQGILSLALVWKYEFHNNPYYKSPYIFSLILKSFHFTKSIQKRDGSFDEWYWNERGWAGPTGYIVHAICQTYFLIEEELSAVDKNSFHEFIELSSKFLMRSWERDVLANHVAMAILAVAESYKILKKNEFKIGLDQLIDKLKDYFYEDEGWSLEYDGADIGYQTGTLSFLARVLVVYDDQRIRQYCKQSLVFLSYFCMPDGSLSSHVGSRQTSNVFHYGLEYFEQDELAIRLADFFYNGLKDGKVLLSSAQEDHYLIYRLPEFFESYIASEKKKTETPTLLPFEKENFNKLFSKAGLCIKNSNEHYVVFSTARGGVIQIYDKKLKKCLLLDTGLTLKFSDKSIWSTLWIDRENKTELKDDEWIVSTSLKKVAYPVFNPLKMIVFRTMSAILGFNEHTAYYFKSFIRKILMNNLKRSQLVFKRRIKFDLGKVVIEDEINFKDEARKIDAIVCNGIFFTRVIPQTKYFYIHELNNFAKERKVADLMLSNGVYRTRVEY